MIKIRLVALLLGLIASNVLFAQKEDSLQVEKEYKIIDSAYRDYRKTQDISVLTTMQSTNLMQTSKGKSGLSMSLAEAKIDLLKKLSKRDAPATQTDSIRKEIYGDFALAISHCKECANLNRAARLEFLQAQKDTNFYKAELAALQELGYPKSREGISLGVTTFIGRDYWLGASFSLNELYNPPSKFRYYKDPLTGESFSKRYTTLKAAFFNFEILWNLNRQAKDINFSWIRISAPFYLDITKIGAMSFAYDNKIYWYYRPEIGFGWNIVSFGYAYNHIFVKSQRDNKERHAFFVKVSYPLFKTK